MQKIGDITPTANAEGEYREGSAATGVGPTLIKAGWLNTVQRELVNAIEGLGIALDPENDSQLLEALEKLAGETAEWAAIKNKPATFPPALHAHSFPSIEQIPPALLALSRMTSLSLDSTLTAEQMGLVQIDASGGARNITLPAATESLGVVDVIVRRTDNSGNRLVVKADGTDRILFHTHLSATGYPFLVLMGAGDWWHLRSDGAGRWVPIGRFDSSALGRPVFETTTAFSPGGWAGLNGFIYNRAEWPWVWDHAQASGMLTTEALRVGNEGKWTSGDGVSTFRSPEGRGAFLRILSEGSAIDTGRGGGTGQAPSNLSHSHTSTRSGFMSNEYPNIQTYHGTTSAGLPSYGGESLQMSSTALSGGAESRPYNVAYPGRLKLI